MKRITLLTIVSMIGLCLSCFSSNGFAFGTNKFEKEVEKEAAAVKLFREIQRGDYKIITTAELHDMMKSENDLFIIDTMPYEASYKKGHIPGAEQFLFPIPEMTEWNREETNKKSVEDFEKFLGPDKERKIVVYCGFVKCTRSHNGAMWARKLGYTNVFRHPGGIFAWKGADYKVEKVK